MSPDDRRQMLVDQPIASMAMLFWIVVAYASAKWLSRGRQFPHALAWAVFVLYAAVVATVPSLRDLDQANPMFFGLRGVTVGLLLASMMSLGQAAAVGRQPAPEAGES